MIAGRCEPCTDSRLQIARDPPARLRIRPAATLRDLFDFRHEHVMAEGYEAHPLVLAPVAA